MAQVQRIRFIGGGRSVTLYAVMDESLNKPNVLPTTDIEAGFPITQFSRAGSRSGSLNIKLVDPIRLENRVSGRAGTATRITSRLPFPTFESKKTQKQNLDFIADVRKVGGTLTLVSELESVLSVAIESVDYKRDKFLNVIGATVKWREIKKAKTATVTIARTGKLDPNNGTFLDSPPNDQGFVVTSKANNTTPEAAALQAAARSKVQEDRLAAGRDLVDSSRTYFRGTY